MYPRKKHTFPASKKFNSHTNVAVPGFGMDSYVSCYYWLIKDATLCGIAVHISLNFLVEDEMCYDLF